MSGPGSRLRAVSVDGNWLRVTPAELERAIDDPGEVGRLITKAYRDGRDRMSGTGEAWQAFDFLLSRQGVGEWIVWGTEAFGDEDEDADDEFETVDDEAMHYLTPAQVATAATALGAVTRDDLVRGVDPADLRRAEIFPQVWHEPGRLDWVTHFLPYAQEFFAAAAKDGDAVICWIG